VPSPQHSGGGASSAPHAHAPQRAPPSPWAEAPLRAQLRAPQASAEDTLRALRAAGLWARPGAQGGDDLATAFEERLLRETAPWSGAARPFQGRLHPAATRVRAAACALADGACATAARLRHVAASAALEVASGGGGGGGGASGDGELCAGQHPQSSQHSPQRHPPPLRQPFRPAGVSRCSASRAAPGGGPACGCAVCLSRPPAHALRSASEERDHAWRGSAFKGALLDGLERRLRLSLAMQVWAAPVRLRAARAVAVDDVTSAGRLDACRAAWRALACAALERREKNARAVSHCQGAAACGRARSCLRTWRASAQAMVAIRTLVARKRCVAAMAHWRLFVYARQRRARLLHASRLLVAARTAPQAFYPWRALARRRALLGARLAAAAARREAPPTAPVQPPPRGDPRALVLSARTALAQRACAAARAPISTVAAAASLLPLRRFSAPPRKADAPTATRFHASASASSHSHQTPASSRSVYRPDAPASSLLGVADAAARASAACSAAVPCARRRSEEAAQRCAAASARSRAAHAAWRSAEQRVGGCCAAAAAAAAEALNATLADRGRPFAASSAAAAAAAAAAARCACAVARSTAAALSAQRDVAAAAAREECRLAAAALSACEADVVRAEQAARVAAATAAAAADVAAARLSGARRDAAAGHFARRHAQELARESDARLADARMCVAASRADLARCAAGRDTSRREHARAVCAYDAVRGACDAARRLGTEAAIEAGARRGRPDAAQADALALRGRAAAAAGVEAARRAAGRVALRQAEAEAAAAACTSAEASVADAEHQLAQTECDWRIAQARAAAAQATCEAFDARVSALLGPEACAVRSDAVAAHEAAAAANRRATPPAMRPSPAARAHAQRLLLRRALRGWSTQRSLARGAWAAAGARGEAAMQRHAVRRMFEVTFQRWRGAATHLVLWRLSRALRAWRARTARDIAVRARIACALSRRRTGSMRGALAAWRLAACERADKRCAVAGALAAARSYAAACASARLRPRVMAAWRARVAERARVSRAAAALLRLRLVGMLRAWARHARLAALLRRVLAPRLEAYAVQAQADALAVSAQRASQVLHCWRHVAAVEGVHRRDAIQEASADAFARAATLVRCFAALAEPPTMRRLQRACLLAWRRAASSRGGRAAVARTVAVAGYIDVRHAAESLRRRAVFALWRRAARSATAATAGMRARALTRTGFWAFVSAAHRGRATREAQHVAQRHALRWLRDVPFAAWRDVARGGARRRDVVLDVTAAKALRTLRAWSAAARASAQRHAQSSAQAQAVLAALRARAAAEEARQQLQRAQLDMIVAPAPTRPPWMPPPGAARPKAPLGVA